MSQDYVPPPHARVFVLDVAHARRWMANGNDPKVWRDSNRRFGGHHVTYFRWVPLDEIASEAVWKDVKIARVLADIDAGKPLRALDVVYGEDVVGPPGKLVITDGIHRLAAARARGLTHVPVLARTWIPVKRRTLHASRASGTVAETGRTRDNRGMKPHTAAAILAIIDAHGLPRTKEKAEPVIQAWLRAHDAQLDRWGNYHLSDGKRVKFLERVVRTEEKTEYGWALRHSDSYVTLALDLAKRAATAAGRGDIERKTLKTKETRKAASERGAAKRSEVYQIKNGPGYYVTNGYNGHGMKMRHADHDKPFLSPDSAIEMAKKKYAELVGMKFLYLLPVQVVRAPDRFHAETPVASVISRDGVELIWEDGHRVAASEDPNQQRLPGMVRGKRLTLAEAKAQVRSLGFSLKSTSFGEYVLTPSKEREGTKSYYTNDLQDAVDTARSQGHCCGLATGAKSNFDTIQVGNRVTILVPAGIGRKGQEWSERTGRAVMRGPHGWVLDLGGRHGTPGIATPENFVSVKSGLQRHKKTSAKR